MTNPDIAAVAAGLTKAQRDRILSWPVSEGGWSTHLPSSERREFRGLVCRAGYDQNRFTFLGLKLRAFLTTDEQAMKEAEHG